MTGARGRCGASPVQARVTRTPRRPGRGPGRQGQIAFQARSRHVGGAGGVDGAGPAAADQQVAAVPLLQRQVPSGPGDQLAQHRRRRLGRDHLLDQRVHRHRHAGQRPDPAGLHPGRVHHLAGPQGASPGGHPPPRPVLRQAGHVQARHDPHPGAPGQQQQGGRAAQRVTLPFQRAKRGAGETPVQPGGELGEVGRADHLRRDGPAPLERRLGPQQVQLSLGFCQHEAAFDAQAQALVGVAGHLLPQLHAGRAQGQRVRHRAAAAGGIDVGHQLDVEAAGIGAARRQAGLAPVGQQHVLALAGQEQGAGQSDDAAADDQDVGIAGQGGRCRRQPARRRRQRHGRVRRFTGWSARMAAASTGRSGMRGAAKSASVAAPVSRAMAAAQDRPRHAPHPGPRGPASPRQARTHRPA